MAATRSGSVLAVDFGSIHTRAVLLDVVEGAYRMVARGETRTTSGYPIGDVSVGLDRVLRDITETTGRRFYGEGGQIITPERPDRSGVDYFLTTVSMGRPLRTVLVGLVPDVSVASGLRATTRTYAQVVETITLDDGRSEEERLNAIILSRPDLIFITGGTEAGAKSAVLELARIVRLALTLIDRAHMPLVLFAGNSALVGPLEDLFEDVTTLLVSPNVRPALEEETLEPAQLQLSKAFDAYEEQHSGDFKMIAVMSQSGILPNAQSYTLMAEFLSALRKDGVLCVDVGSAVSTMALAHGGQVATSIRTDIGLGHSAYTALQAIGPERLRHWLPFNVTPSELVNYALNKSLRPQTVPATLRDLYLEHALLRASIETLRDSLRQPGANHGPHTPGLIIGAGAGITHTGHPGYSALLLLDALQPTGITVLQADPYALIPALGALALVSPEAVVQLVEGSSLERLGTSINLSGAVKPGKPALKLKFKIEGEVFEHEVEGGSLWVLPLGAGKKVQVEIRVIGGGLHIGGKKRLKLTVEGGTAGLIFDARGRPLPLADTARGRAAQFPQWVAQMTGDPVQEIEEQWLVDIGKAVEEKPRPKRAKAPRQRRGLFGRGGKAEVAPAKEDAEDLEFERLLEEEEEKDDSLSELRRDVLS